MEKKKKNEFEEKEKVDRLLLFSIHLHCFQVICYANASHLLLSIHLHCFQVPHPPSPSKLAFRACT